MISCHMGNPPIRQTETIDYHKRYGISFLHISKNLIQVYQMKKSKFLFYCPFIVCFLIAIECSAPTLKMPESLPPIVKEYKQITLWGTRPGMVSTRIHLNKGDIYSILATGSVDLSVRAGSWFKYHDVRPEHGWPLMVRRIENQGQC